MNACAAIDFRKADSELNAAWREAIASAQQDDRALDRSYDQRPTTEAKAARGAARLDRLRDAHCTVEGYQRSARRQHGIRWSTTSRRAQLTRERTRQLSGPSE